MSMQHWPSYCMCVWLTHMNWIRWKMAPEARRDCLQFDHISWWMNYSSQFSVKGWIKRKKIILQWFHSLVMPQCIQIIKHSNTSSGFLRDRRALVSGLPRQHLSSFRFPPLQLGAVSCLHSQRGIKPMSSEMNSMIPALGRCQEPIVHFLKYPDLRLPDLRVCHFPIHGTLGRHTLFSAQN